MFGREIYRKLSVWSINHLLFERYSWLPFSRSHWTLEDSSTIQLFSTQWRMRHVQEKPVWLWQRTIDSTRQFVLLTFCCGKISKSIAPQLIVPCHFMDFFFFYLFEIIEFVTHVGDDGNRTIRMFFRCWRLLRHSSHLKNFQMWFGMTFIFSILEVVYHLSVFEN